MAIVDILNAGGFMMWVILGLSMVATAIGLERFISLFILGHFNTRRFLDGVTKKVEERDYKGALEDCNQRTWHPMPTVVRAGLAKANRRDKEIEKSMEAEMLRLLPGIQRGLGFLSLLGNVATLLGLLGTIFGLIQAFSAVSAANAADRQQALAEGISVAMYTTAFGIIAAVPILFMHTILSGKVDKVLIQMEEGATAVLAALGGRLRTVEAPVEASSDQDAA